MKYTQPVRGSPPAAGTTTSYGTNWQELSGIKNGSSFCFAKCRKVKVSMAFFGSAITILQTLVTAIGAGLGVWGVINLLEGYGNDNPGAKSQGIKQLMAGGGVILIGTQLVPQLSGLIEEWMRTLLTTMVTSNLQTMFTDVNEKTGEIATQVGQTPQGWNGSIFSMIQNLSSTVILPIAGMIITFVLCYELISMLTEKNNMHDIDTWMFFKYFFKMMIAVYLVSNTFNITMAVFDVGQHVVNSAAGVITQDAAIDVTELLSAMETAMEDMEVGELVVLALETLLVSFGMKIMSVVITIACYGRMIEIYLYTSVAPIPFATMTNREWGQIGTNYLRGLFALAFQAFLMMVCVGIYGVLVASIRISANMHAALFGIAAYTVLLCYTLFKTGSLSKQIFNAH